MVATAHLREGRADDAVSGVVPGQVATPATRQEVAELLALASRERWQTVIRGGGTKMGWGRVPEHLDLVVDTGKLNLLIAHRYGDLTATVEAGATLAGLNRALGERGQWLPVESPFDATVGGLVATNESGPSRHLHGTPRDLLIGVTLALADGRLVKAGGTVVKNVAGYDLGRLVSGSYGSLAAIVDATFKLMPLPQASATLAVSYKTADALAADVAALGGSQLEPMAVDCRFEPRHGASPVCRLLTRFASSPQATDAQLAAARAAMHGEVTEVRGGDEAALWAEQTGAPWQGPGGLAVVRLSWLPAHLGRVLALVEELQRAGDVSFSGRAGVGAGFLTLAGNDSVQAAAVERLRSSDVVGHVVVLTGSRELKQRVDVWGPPASSAPMANALKRMLDPAGILNANRGPI